MTGYLIKHHERFSPFIMAEDSATSSSMADAKVSVLLNGTQGDAGELNAEMLTLCAESDCLCVCVCVCVWCRAVVSGLAAMRGYCQREVEPMGKESEQVRLGQGLTQGEAGLRVSHICCVPAALLCSAVIMTDDGTAGGPHTAVRIMPI